MGRESDARRRGTPGTWCVGPEPRSTSRRCTRDVPASRRRQSAEELAEVELVAVEVVEVDEVDDDDELSEVDDPPVEPEDDEPDELDEPDPRASFL